MIRARSAYGELFIRIVVNCLMNPIILIIELLFLGISCALGIMWLRHPDQNWEPWTYLAGGATALLEIVRHNYAGEEAKVRRPHFTISNVWLTVKDNPFFSYEFAATIINEGDRPDVLREITAQLYLRNYGFIDSAFTCGGRQVIAPTGQILPIECLPRIAYRIDGVGDVGIIPSVWERIVARADRDDYVLRCTFVFAVAKPLTVRANRMGVLKHSPMRHFVREALLRLSSRGKNPFRDEIAS